jgi:hypothetical protein
VVAPLCHEQNQFCAVFVCHPFFQDSKFGGNQMQMEVVLIVVVMKFILDRAAGEAVS